MAATSLMREFSWCQFVVLGKQTQLVFKRTTSKEHAAAKKEEISEFIAKKCLFEIVSRRNMCDWKQDLQIIT